MPGMNPLAWYRRNVATPWALIPAGVVAACLLTTYFFLRGAWRGGAAVASPMGGPGGAAPATLAAWLMFIAALSSFTCIFWTACVSPAPGHRSRVWLGYALVADICGLILLATSIDSALGLLAAFRVYALLLGFLAFCTMMAQQLRRFGAGATTAVAGAVIFIMLAMPLVAAPLLTVCNRADSGTGAAIIANLCPIFWILHAANPTLHYGWFSWLHTPLMYTASPLGQNMRMPRILPWWVLTLATLATAAVGSLPEYFVRRRRA